MSDPGPARRFLESLLNGFDFYSRRERLTADDLLVRQEAARRLAEAAAAVRAARSAYAQDHVPHPTREQPLPPPEAMAPVRRAERLEAALAAAAEEVRSATLPATDRTWRRLRSDLPLLELVLEHDRQLIQAAEEARRLAAAVSGDGLAAADLEPAMAATEAVRRAFHERMECLRLPGT
jgi:hypothetical protein